MEGGEDKGGTCSGVLHGGDGWVSVCFFFFKPRLLVWSLDRLGRGATAAHTEIRLPPCHRLPQPQPLPNKTGLVVPLL